jgi:hypothetical protein
VVSQGAALIATTREGLPPHWVRGAFPSHCVSGKFFSHQERDQSEIEIECFIAVKMRIMFFWLIMPNSLASGYQQEYITSIFSDIICSRTLVTT